MKAYIFTILLFSTFLFTSFSQSTLNGFVTELNSGKKPVSNFQIKAFGANQVISTTLGQFILTFQNFPIGKDVKIRAEKAGWEIVNEKELETFIPENPNAKPLKIVVCKVGVLAKAKKLYHDITDDYILKEYNKKLALISKEKEGWEKEVANLNEQLQILQNQLGKISDELSRQNLDDLNGNERKIIELFKLGKIDECIKLREEFNSKDEILKAILARNIADSTIKIHTTNLYQLINYYNLKFDYYNVELKYEELIYSDTTNFENLLNYSSFLLGQFKYDKALKILLTGTKMAKSEYDLAKLNNYFGSCYFAFEDYEKAKKYFTTGNLFFKKNVKVVDDKDYFIKLYELGISEFMLGRVLDEQGKKIESYDAIFRSSNIFGILVNKFDSDEYAKRLVESLNSIGKFYQLNKSYNKAKEAYENALTYAQIVQKRNPKSNYLSLGILHYNLGTLYEKLNDPKKAIFNYNLGLEICEAGYKVNPFLFCKYYSWILNNLGIIDRKDKKYDLSHEKHFKAFSILHKCMQANPLVYDIEYCTTVSHLGFSQMINFKAENTNFIMEIIFDAKEILKKYSHLEEAKNLLFNITSYEKTLNKNITLKLIDSLKINLKNSNISDKITFQNNIKDQYIKLVNAGFSEYNYNIGSSYGNLAYYNLFIKDFKKAEENANEALNPKTFSIQNNYKSDIQWVKVQLAFALIFQNKFIEARNIILPIKDITIEQSTFGKIFLDQIEELEKFGFSHLDLNKIKELMLNK